MRELSGPLSVLIEMTTCGSFCNEPFSLGVLQLLKVQMKAKPCAAEPRARESELDRSRAAFLRFFLWCFVADPAGDGAASRAEEHLPDAAGVTGESPIR